MTMNIEYKYQQHEIRSMVTQCYKKVTVILLLANLQMIAQAQEPLKLSLNEAIEYATNHSPSFQNSRTDIKIAAAKKFESITRYLPKLNAAAEYRNNLNLAVTPIPTKIFNPAAPDGEFQQVRFGVKYNATAGLDANVSLLDLGNIGEIISSNESQKLSNLQLQQATADLKLNVSKAYYNVLLNKERIAKAESALRRNQKVYEDVQVRFNNQNAIKTEVNRAYLNLQQSRYQLQLSKDAYTNAQLQLLQAIGAPLNSTAELTDVLPTNITADTIISTTSNMNNRIELKAEQQHAQITKSLLKKTYYQYAPNLSFFGYIGGQGFSDKANVFGEKWNQISYIGLRLNMPVFDGLLKVAVAQQQKLLLQKNKNNLQSIEQTINYQVQAANLNLSNAARNLKIQQQNIALAEDILRDTKSRYDNAFAIYQEVVDAENLLKEAEVFYLTALYEYLVADLEWKKANGTL